MIRRLIIFSILISVLIIYLSEAQIRKQTQFKIGNGTVVHESVTIGSQVWMKKNLNVDHYANGDIIPHVTDSTAWVNLTSGAWRYYNDDPSTGAIYGKLYNWYAVNDPRSLAPEGWHVPTEDEWTVLVSGLGADLNAGKMLKEVGTSHWLSPNTSATNESGFTALPGGSLRYGDTYFSGLGSVGYWWTSSGSTNPYAKMRGMFYNGTSVYRGTIKRTYGFSVRCVKD
jgi:uncharacterized protein (TIGR02145 family)